MKYLNIFSLAIIFVLASATTTLAQKTEDKAQVISSTKTLTTKVKGITCSSDLKTISANVEKLKGVKACKAGKTGPTTAFEVSYNPALITEKEIYSAIQGTPGCKSPNDRPYQIKQ
ncbi:heavy-metal-associated domain-containing protein [Pedobacter arcticus]|uniref:heavy-metal-associated domain-containing protein n=1 Tax=Pedobacter arcticus TaxID=752140 RepID=UPI0002FE6BD9|nr:hypothetical protein [Pedobacter arcticus]